MPMTSAAHVVQEVGTVNKHRHSESGIIWMSIPPPAGVGSEVGSDATSSVPRGALHGGAKGGSTSTAKAGGASPPPSPGGRFAPSTNMHGASICINTKETHRPTTQCNAS